MQQKFLKGIEPREYQQKIFETCKEKNCLVVLPTGVGKTLIALMLTIHYLEKHPEKKVVMLAPTKPLAEQHFSYFKKHTPELFADIALFTGAVKPKERKKIWETTSIIFSTPQCVGNDVRKRLYTLTDVSLLIEDEAHRCVKQYDYNFLAQEYKKQASVQRIIGLTASPGSDATKIKMICKNLGIEAVELRTRESNDVKKYLQELTFQKIEVAFPPELEEMRHVLKKLFDTYIEELRYRKVLFGPSTKTGLIELQKKIMASLARGNNNYSYMLGASACASAIKIQHALELLETQTLQSFHSYLKDLFKQASAKKSKGVVKLVSNPSFNFVFMQANELLAKNFEHPKAKKLKELVQKEQQKNEKSKLIIFMQYRDTASMIAKNLNKLEGIRASVFVGQAKKKNTGLSQKEQRAMLEEFKEGKINVLCATSIGEEGLDIPEVNAVMFYEPVPSAIRSIQRAGRTARLMKGKLFILITKGTRDETFYYISRAKEKSMHKAIDTIKNNLHTKQEKQKTL